MGKEWRPLYQPETPVVPWNSDVIHRGYVRPSYIQIYGISCMEHGEWGYPDLFLLSKGSECQVQLEVENPYVKESAQEICDVKAWNYKQAKTSASSMIPVAALG